MKRRLFSVALFLVATNGGLANAQQLPNWEPVAKQLQTSTVTVRVCTRDCAKLEAGTKDTADKLPAKEETARPQVSVCSGFFVAEKLVITAIHAGTDSSIRLTYHDGTQGCGTLKVVDEYSGLVLLETDEPCPAKLEVEAACPAAGSWVMTAAAWGTEKPLVSLGIVSATDRTVADVSYPPLLQCDLRISETSGGSAVVDQACHVVGVMVAADAGEMRRGWAYAVPAVHVSRLLRAEKDGETGSVVVLKRRRPIVGLVLDGDERGIYVTRVHKDTPADKGGIEVGDQIVAAEGVKIRSVYQAVLPTLRKQPGDLFTLRIKRNQAERDVSLVLGGGMELASAPLDVLGGLVKPKIEIQSDRKGSYQLGPLRNSVKDLAGNAPAAGPESLEFQILEKAVERYRSTIEAQRIQIEMLQRELAELKGK